MSTGAGDESLDEGVDVDVFAGVAFEASFGPGQQQELRHECVKAAGSLANDDAEAGGAVRVDGIL
jgi:hypothetical protein